MGGVFPPKKLLMTEQKLFWANKNYEKIVLNRTNDQIMPRLVRNFKNDRYIFQ